VIRLLIRSLVVAVVLGPPLPLRAQPPDRPAENATAARIADGVEKAQAGKLLDAVEQFQRVLDTAGDELVPVDRSWYTPARWVVHAQIARLPADGLRLYRQRVDGQSAKRLDEAKKSRDDAGLNRLLADMFAAKASEDAILELARRSFERGEFDAADRYWRLLLPAAEDEQPLHFPDPKTPPAAIRARLILVKLFRGDRDEAKRELELLKEKYPNDTGLLAGENGKYVDILTKLIGHPSQTTLARLPDEPGWPTFAGSPARTGTNRAKLPYFWPDVPSWRVRLPFDGGGRFDGPRGDPHNPRALAFLPVVGEGRAFVADGARVAAIDLMSGQSETVARPDGGEETAIPTRQDVRFTLTEADGILYARLGPAALRAGEKPSYIVALGPPTGITQERTALWRLNPPAADGASTQFEGAPTVQSGRLYTAFWRSAGADAQAGIACYRIDDPKAAAPELAWQRLVGKAGSEPNGETRYRHNLITLSGPNVVYCTDGGTVIALNAATGQPAWEYRYPRNERPTLPRYRDLCPPLADGGRIYAAPADTDRLLCLDAATGRLIWEREGVEVIHLLGVARGRLIATFGGIVRGIRGLNLWTGADSGAGGWTIHDPGGEGTFGRGLVTDEVVVWPTRHGLRFLDPADGTQLRSPIHGPTARGPGGVMLPADTPQPFGNLCYADGALIVTTATEVWGFVSEAKKLGERRKAVGEEPDDPARHADLAQSLIDSGEYAEAETEAEKAGDGKNRLRWLLAERLIRDGKQDNAMRLYEELAKGDGSFAAAGAARLAEINAESDKRREKWRVVFAKRGILRDENGIPWAARAYAENQFGDLLAMHATIFPEDDSFVSTKEDLTHRIPNVFVRSSAPNGEAIRHAAARLPAYRPELPILSRISHNSLPSASANDGPGGLEPSLDGALSASFVYDRRFFVKIDSFGRLLAVVAAPISCLADLLPIAGSNSEFELVQTAGGQMLVHNDLTEIVREFPCTTKPWTQPPTDVGSNRFLIPDDGSVFLFDAKAGKELARYTLPGSENLSGELPRFRIHQGDPLIIIDRNYGVEVDRLRIDGLKRVWERSPVFVGRGLDDVAFEGDRFFTAANGVLAAHDWKTGNPLWDTPLPELTDGKWKLAIAPQGLLAYPSDAIRRHPEFDALGEFRRAGWDTAALLWAVGHTYDVWADRELPVIVIDPSDGRLVQQLNFPAAGPAAGVAVTAKGVVVVTGKGSWTLTARR
jgi:outer membrane protein assembly factor BamB